MWLILACSIVALAIVIDRLLGLMRIDDDTAPLLKEVKRAVQTRKFGKAQELCDQNGTPLSRILKSGIQRFGKSRGETLEWMQETLSEEIPHIQRHVPLLGSIAHMTPLIGLLGTVTGLVRCFQTIQEKSSTLNAVNPGDLAGGIWEALLTTVFGLLVAIPSYAMYNYIADRTNSFSHQMDSIANKFSYFLSDEAQRATGVDPSSHSEKSEAHAPNS